MPMMVYFKSNVLAMVPKSRLQVVKQPGGGYSTYKQGIYCGPHWGFTTRDVKEGRIKSLPKAFDAIDEACKAHDECYDQNGYLTQKCNIALSSSLAKIVISADANGQQRMDAAVMAAIFRVEALTLDVDVLVYREVDAMRDRMLGYMGDVTHTFEDAINREIVSRRSQRKPVARK